MNKLKEKARQTAKYRGHRLSPQWFGHPSWYATSVMCVDCDGEIHINYKTKLITGTLIERGCKQTQAAMSPKETARKYGQIVYASEAI